MNRSVVCAAPGTVDESLGEFWVGNPWAITETHSLSGYERNRAYLNTGGTNFLDISYIAGLDADGDGRAAVAADVNYDGRMDLIVRQVGGGPLLVYSNNFPQRNWLKISLRGTTSNRLGIGSRIDAVVGGASMTRELYPINTILSQGPTYVHFGLGRAERVDKLTIRWPSGEAQTLTDIEANQHILIREGRSEIDRIVPGAGVAGR